MSNVRLHMTGPIFVAHSGLPTWLPSVRQPRNFHPCHIENTSFEAALSLFGATPSTFKATRTAPRGGRQFRLKLTSGRHALLVNYDDFPKSVEICLELSEASDGEEVAYLSDLAEILVPLQCPIPDKSRVGFPVWR